MSVVTMVVGATTPDGATFVAKVDGGGPVRVAVSTDPGMTSPVFTSSQAVDAQGVAKVSITGLDSATRHYWQVEDNSVIDTTVGQFRTHPTLGVAANFVIAVASCAGASPAFPGVLGTELNANRVSDHPVFDTIREADPLLFAHTGDFHYYDLGSGSHGIVGGASLANYRAGYDDVIGQPRQHHLYRTIPLVYAWDDHDYGPNNSDGTFADKANAAQVYRERAPHYPLNDSGGIWQSFQIGRVLFILSDTRYYRSPNSDPDTSSKSMLGTVQKAWFEDQIANTTAEALVWLMPDDWLGSGTDSWELYQTEQAELVAMLETHGWLDRMVMVYGDRHMVGLTGGATNPWGGFPVMNAASLDSSLSTPVTGRFDVIPETPGKNQYGTVSVSDSGSVIAITLEGWNGTTSLGSYTHSIVFPQPPVSLPDVTGLLSGSIDVVWEVRVLETFQTGEDPSGTTVELLDGEVTLDATTDIRGDASLRISGTIGQDGPLAWPRGKDRTFAPFGNEVFIRYGFELGGNVGTLWVPLGYYAIMDTDQEDAPDGPIELACEDRMAPLIESELIDPRVYDPPATVGDVFNDLILDLYPDAVIQFDDGTDSIPLARQVIADKSRYKPLKDLAEVFGKIFYWDDIGIARIETPPDPTEIAWFVRSQRDGVLVNASRKLSRRGIFNAVVVEGEGADTKTPVRVVAYDNDPNSPTRFGGRIGKVPKFVQSPLITTIPQGVEAAGTLLRLAIGAPHSVKFGTIVNPALRPLQAVEIMYSNNERDIHIIDSVTIPLDEDKGMSADTREQALFISEII